MKIEEIIPLLRQGGYCTVETTNHKFTLEGLNDGVDYNNLFTREDYTYFPSLKEKPKSETYPNMDIGFLYEVWKGFVRCTIEHPFYHFAEEFGFNPCEAKEFTENRKNYE